MDQLKLVLAPDASEGVRRAAVDAALFLGFHRESMEFPILAWGEEKGIHLTDGTGRDEDILLGEDGIFSALKQFAQRNPSFLAYGMPELSGETEYTSALDNAQPVPNPDCRRKKGLESLFSEGFSTIDRNQDRLADALLVKLDLPPRCSNEMLSAACSLAARFGMETTAYEGSILYEQTDEPECLIRLEGGAEVSMKLEWSDGRKVIHLTGDGEELEQFISWLCEHFPEMSSGESWPEKLVQLQRSFAMMTVDGQLAVLKASGAQKGEAFLSPQFEPYGEAIQHYFPEVSFHSYQERKTIFRREFTPCWEVDTLLERLDRCLKDEVNPGDSVAVYGAVSEDSAVRRELEQTVRQRIQTAGGVCERAEVLCAYKPGYCWLTESVAPRLQECASLKTVTVAFRAFLPDGVTEWYEEDGATPSYLNIATDQPDKWYDMPIRFLQELYPADDVLAARLNLPRSAISFEGYRGDKELTYEVTALDEGGNVLLRDDYQVRWTERPYLNRFPGMGKVHPTTGYLRVEVNGREVLNSRIPTDLEQLWEMYQSEVLPEVAEMVEKRTDGAPDAAAQPFFSCLEIDVTASEPDEPIGFRQDLLSSLDALHEDFYFVTLDYFKVYGKERTGQIFDAPGLILPLIHKGTGGPRMVVTLYDTVRPTPAIEVDGSAWTPDQDKQITQVWVDRIQWNQGKPKLSIQVESTAEKHAMVQAFAELMKAGICRWGTETEGISSISFRDGDTCLGEATLEQAPETARDLNIAEIDLMENRLIGYDDFMELVPKLKRVPGIRVRHTADSYNGRPLYAIELLPNRTGYVSLTKRLTRYPSVLLNARHHANEVSSTNSSLIVLKNLLTDEKYRGLADRMNLVIVPMENTDGAALGYELQKEHPNWIFHSARFDALGMDFYLHYFRDETIHSEAKGLTGLWNRFLPDLIIDDHGVPTHEWDQPFSGYTSPSFKGFWLPRSILYGMVYTITNPEYQINHRLGEAIQDAVAERIGEDKALAALNRDWMEVFEKYAHRWMPRQFPADYYRDMIMYWVKAPHNPEHRYSSIRYPWITSIVFVSETADETAQGSYLGLCANAHVQEDLAIIDLFLKCKAAYCREIACTDTGPSVSCIRQRPILFPTANETER